MVAYIIRRLLLAIVTIWAVTVLAFLIIQLPPGDFVDTYIASLSATGSMVSMEEAEALRELYGLDQPIYVQYLKWMGRILKGNLGVSLDWQRPITELISERLVLTVMLGLFTFGFTWVVAIPIGILSATRQYSFFDYFFTIFNYFGVATPTFMTALVLMWLAFKHFGVSVTGLFSPEYIDAPWTWGRVVDLLKHMWIPSLIAAVTGSAGLIRIMRANLLDTLGMPFVEAARARGLKNRTVIWKHAVRIAINPLIVILGSEHIPGIINRNMLLAYILNLPTIGPVFIEALLVQDSYMAGTCLVFLIMLTLIGNLLSDIGLAWLDPRIRLE